jgi:lipoprotein-releasing system permease protein
LSFPLYIAKRYLVAKSKQNAINIITRITGLVVVVGAFSLFVVLAGFAGLKEFSLSFINNFDPDLKVFPIQGKTLTTSNQLKDALQNTDGIAAYSFVVEDKTFFKYRDKSHVGVLKGVDDRYGRVHDIDSMMAYGNWIESGKPQVVAGFGVANVLSLPLFDYENPLVAMAPKPGKGSIDRPDEAFEEINLFSVGLYNITEEIDKKYVFTDWRVAQKLFSIDTNQVSYVEFKLMPNADEAKVVAALQQVFTENVDIKNRMQLNDALYKMLNTENLATYLIFTLIIIVALFNVAGSTIMMILDKKANLKTLYSLGASLSQIRRIFFLQGTLLSVSGAVIGILLATLLVWIQQKWSLVMITPTLAYPVKLEWTNYVVVFLTIVILGMLASKIAANRIREKMFL